MKKGVYPEGFEAWKIAAIEQFKDTHPKLYEWRRTAHLLVENFARPRSADTAFSLRYENSDD